MPFQKRFFKRTKNNNALEIIQNSVKAPVQIDTGIFFWVPRILGLIFIGFLSIFALDVISSYQGIHIVFPLIMHLLPEMILLGCIVVAWKFDIFEAGIFFAFGLLYIFLVGLHRDWTWYAFISGPALVISLLFVLDWYIKRKKVL